MIKPRLISRKGAASLALIASLSLTLIGVPAFADTNSSAHNRSIPIDSNVITQHETKILGKRVKYSATTGTQPVWNSEDEAVATLFYTYYQRTDIKDNASRPLIISFNGGLALPQCGCMLLTLALAFLILIVKVFLFNLTVCKPTRILS